MRAVGSAPLRRLTRADYDRTVRDVLAEARSIATGTFAASDEKVGPFDANSIAPVLRETLEDYMRAAEAIAAPAVARQGALLSCGPTAATEQSCAQKLVETFGRRLYRRPLSAQEAEAYRSLYDRKRSTSDFVGAATLVLETMLQSPHFLYRFEPGGAPRPGSPDLLALDPHALAARLSHFLWGSAPDEDLLQAAANDALATAGAVETHARRMLASDKAREIVRSFHVQWLGLDQPSGDGLDEATATAARAETGAFVDHVFASENGRLGTLLTASYAFVDGALAPVYGVEAPAAKTLVRRDLDPAQRAGLLTQVGPLANHTDIVHRGKFVREAILCTPVPAVPPGLNPEPPPPGALPALVRELAQMRLSNRECGACHRLMDPIGLGFASYDGTGRFHAADRNGPIDSSGELTFLSDGSSLPFRGAPELANILASRPEVRDCVIEQWFRFGFGRVTDTADACTLAEVRQAFVRSGHDVRELLVAMTKTDAFRYRRPGP